MPFGTIWSLDWVPKSKKKIAKFISSRWSVQGAICFAPESVLESLREHLGSASRSSSLNTPLNGKERNFLRESTLPKTLSRNVLWERSVGGASTPTV